MKPGLCVHRRHTGGSIPVVARRELPVLQGADLLGIPLFHHPEAAKFALFAVEIAVVIGVAGDEAVVADVVIGLDPLDHMNREGQAGDPGLSGGLVLQIEFRRRCILNPCLCAQIVSSPDQQMRLPTTHEVDIAHGLCCVAGQRRGPDEAGSTVAKQVNRHDVDQVVHAREDLQCLRLAPAVARLVEVEAHAFAVQIDDVGGTTAVDVGQADAFVIKLIR